MPSRYIRSQRVRNTPADLAKHLAYNGRCAVQLGDDGKRFDYGNRTDHAEGGTIYPRSLQDDPPERVRMWQALQASVRRDTETIATALMAILPRADELTMHERIALIQEFCAPISDIGHIIDWNMHRGRNGNWHVHFLISTSGMTLDEKPNPLPGSPYRVSWRTVKEKKAAREVKKIRQAIKPPWQRLWQVAQERFFKRRGIELRVPASTAIIRRGTEKQRAIKLRPATSRGYASDDAVTTWHARRRAFFSDPSLYLAALTRDRLLIEQRDIDAFNTMIWGEHALPETIEGLFRSNRGDQPPDLEWVGSGRVARFGNGAVTTRESFGLLYRAMRAAITLGFWPFIGEGELAGPEFGHDIPSMDGLPLFISIACQGSFGIVSAAKSEDLLPVGEKEFLSRGLVPVFDHVTKYVELLFITADHVSYLRHGEALKRRNWGVIGVTEFLKRNFADKFLANETYRKRGVMLIVLDAQRISEPRLATLICVAQRLQRKIGRLRLLLMKPDDVTAEPVAPLLERLSRTQWYCEKSDSEKRPEVNAAALRNTFHTRFPGSWDKFTANDIVVGDLPPAFSRDGASRQERHAAIQVGIPQPDILRNKPISLAELRARNARRASMQDEPPTRDLMIIVGSSPDPRASGLSRLRPGDKVLVTQNLPDQGLSAGTILTIGEVKGENGLFYYRDPAGGGQISVDAQLAHHFLPIDMVSARDAFLVLDHLDAIRAQLDCFVFVIVDELAHAESLLTLASSLGKTPRKVIIDKRLCNTPDELIALIDRSPFGDALDALADIINAKPMVSAFYCNDPNSDDAIFIANEIFEPEEQTAVDASLTQERQAHAPAGYQMQTRADDDDDYDDAVDVEALAGCDPADDDFRFEDDPDTPWPEFWDDEPDDEPEEEPGDEPEDEPDR